MEANTTDEFGDGQELTVTLLSIRVDPETNSTIRELELEVGPDGATKKVWHMLFEGWPDFLVPEADDRAALLNLVTFSRTTNTAFAPGSLEPAKKDDDDDQEEEAEEKKDEDEDTDEEEEEEEEEEADEEAKGEGVEDEAKKKDDGRAPHFHEGDNPRIVHCSAGVGRSGTFMALDWLLTELHEGSLDEVPPDSDPILEVVEMLRTQRMMMVQAEPQFWFLYNVMREQWIRRWRERTGQPVLANVPSELGPPSDIMSEGHSEVSMETAPEEPLAEAPSTPADAVESDEELEEDSDGAKSEADKEDDSDTESEEHDDFRKELEAEIEQNVASAALA
jgi:protein tyrosine phosphatase